MAKLNSVKKIVVEDYSQENRELVQRLALTLNSFLDQTTVAINGGLTIRENQKAKIYAVDLKAGVVSKTVAYSLNEKPTAVILANLTKSDTSAPSQPFCLSWRYSSEGLELTFIGLDGSTDHKATVIALV
jgi:hypothetical protein